MAWSQSSPLLVFPLACLRRRWTLSAMMTTMFGGPCAAVQPGLVGAYQ